MPVLGIPVPNNINTGVPVGVQVPLEALNRTCALNRTQTRKFWILTINILNHAVFDSIFLFY